MPDTACKNCGSKRYAIESGQLLCRDCGAEYSSGEIKAPDRLIEIFIKAVLNGDEGAKQRLSNVIKGEKRSQAISYLEHLAEAGNIVAKRSLAFLVREVDRSRAIDLYRQAANTGDSEALFNLAEMAEGEDYHKALLLLEQASEAGNLQAMNNLALLLEAENRDRAFELLEKAAEGGDSWALTNLAIRVQNEDRERAIELLKRSSDIGDAIAINYLAVMIENEDRDSAKRLYEQAVGLDDANAMSNLAILILSENRGRAIELFERASELGLTSAMVNLSDCIINEDQKRAISLLEQAVSLSDNLAKEKLLQLQQIERQEKERRIRAEQQRIRQEQQRRLTEQQRMRAEQQSRKLETIPPEKNALTEPSDIAGERILLKAHSSEKSKRDFYLREAKRRGVIELIHFTRIENLDSILLYGISPRCVLDSNRVPYMHNDTGRYDGYQDASCLSVSFPNSKLFYTFRKSKGGTWAVFSLSPDLFLSDSIEKFYFFERNASRGDSNRCSFREMFGNPSSKYPEDVQAEILVFGVVDSRFISKVYVETEEDRRALGSIGKPIEVRGGMFQQREWVI
ncbi:MAG: DarT ssDNA thymidine ADP-ribosyltransferase family protein [Coriobacteriia bacterium]|nr:DarT ssDNA thymidine ADP-ribosyltransferase family protein [Coriobacteriia bacterium]MCL2750621.1 DarT ssDNA thymidine ADP-ribosyltransferase family protein [Coriobacteriia bacterium]